MAYQEKQYLTSKFETILFDADNTLFDNGNIHELVTEKILQEMGLDLAEAKKTHQSWDEFYFQEQK